MDSPPSRTTSPSRLLLVENGCIFPETQPQMSSRETESAAKVSGVATEQGELKDEEMNSDGSERAARFWRRLRGGKGFVSSLSHLLTLFLPTGHDYRAAHLNYSSAFNTAGDLRRRDRESTPPGEPPGRKRRSRDSFNSSSTRTKRPCVRSQKLSSTLYVQRQFPSESEQRRDRTN